MKKEIIVPKAGLTMTEATVGLWLVSEGDPVEKDQVVLELATDKITVEVTAPYDGIMVSILHQEGETVATGECLAIMETEAAEAERSSASQAASGTAGEGKKYDVAVIGAGPGGYVAAIRAAQLGGKVALIEQRDLGGTCLNTGCIPTKTLLRASEFVKMPKTAAEYGVFFEKPRVDYSRLIDYKDQVVRKLQNGVAGLLHKNKIELLKGLGRVVDPHTIEVRTEDRESHRIEANHIIVASGSQPHMPEIPGLKQAGPMTSTEALAGKERPRSVAIIGAGAIGCEFAGIYAPLGTEVTLIESADQILPGTDRDLARVLAESLHQEQVRILTSATITRIDIHGGRKVVHVKTAQGAQAIEVDAILAATGRRPDLEQMRELGVRLEGGKIAVDDQMRTSIPSIYAVGDVTGIEFLAHVASAQGVVAAEAAMGRPSRMDYRTVTRCIYTSPEIASVGLNERQAKEQGRDYQIGKYAFEANGRAMTYGETAGFVKVLRDTRYGEILGIHIIGPNASELIGEAMMAVHLEATAEEFALAIHPHPTLSEVLVEAILASMGRGIHS